MANEIDQQLVDQIKKIADSLDDSSKFTREMNESIRSMGASLRSVADLTRTVSEFSKSFAESQSVVVESLRQITTGTSQLSSETQKQIEQAKLQQELAKAATEQIKMTVQETRSLYELDKMAESDKLNARNRRLEEENRLKQLLAEQSTLMSRIADAEKESMLALAKKGYEYDRQNGEMRKRAGASAALARATVAVKGPGTEAITGFRDLSAAIGSITSRLAGLAGLGIGSAGVGGLLGLMIEAIKDRAAWGAVGQQVSQQFDVIGEGGDRLAGRMGSLAKSLNTSFAAAKGELQSVARAFAEVGVSGAEAMQKMEGVKTGFGGELITATLAADKAFEMAAGSMAKLAGSMARDFNTSAKESFVNLMNIGAAAKEAGFNAAQFMQSSMQAASSLKMLNANGEAVIDMQLRFAKGMTGQGYGKAFSAQMAQAGATSVAGSIANMQEGFAAVIAERMGMGTGLDAMMALKNPFARDGEGLDINKVVSIMGDIAREAGATRNEQRSFLQKTMGLDNVGAEMVLNARDALERGEQLDPMALKEIERGLRTEQEKTSSIDRAIELIKQAFLNIGLVLLEGILMVSKSTYAAISGIYNVIMGFMVGGDAKQKYYDVAAENFREGAAAVGRADAIKARATTAAGQLARAFNLGEQAVMQDTKEEIDARANRIAAEGRLNEYLKKLASPEEKAKRAAAKLFMAGPIVAAPDIVDTIDSLRQQRLTLKVDRNEESNNKFSPTDDGGGN